MRKKDPCEECLESGALKHYGRKKARHYGGALGEQAYDWGVDKAIPAAKSLASFFGMGDYKLNFNTLIDGGGSTDQKVKFTDYGPRGVRIRFREYLGDVTAKANGAFAATHYEINPGVPTTFPWLSGIANQYDQYNPQGMIFEYLSTSSDYASGTSLGSVVMATEYDIKDAPFSSKVEMLNSAFSNEGKISQNSYHGLECDPKERVDEIMYTRGQVVPADGNARFYDFARFTIATQGGSQSTDVIVGSLYLHYDIIFYKEQVYRSPIDTSLHASWTVAPFTGTFGAIADNSLIATGSTLSATLQNVGGVLRVNMPSSLASGSYQIDLRAFAASGMFGSTPTTFSLAFGLVNNITAVLGASPSYGLELATGSNTLKLQLMTQFTITGTNAWFSLTGWPVTSQTIDVGVLKIFQIPTAMLN